MKRIVCVILIMAFTLAAAIFESIFCTRFYSEMYDELVAIDVILIKEDPSADGELLARRTDELLKEWEKTKKIMMAFSNHAIIRTLDEKLVCIKAWVDKEKYDNAHEFCSTAIRLSGELMNETHLIVSNLL